MKGQVLMVRFLGWQFTQSDSKCVVGDQKKVERFKRHGYQVTETVDKETYKMTKPARLVMVFNDGKNTFGIDMMAAACEFFGKKEITRRNANDFVKAVKSSKVEVQVSPESKTYTLIKKL